MSDHLFPLAHGGAERVYRVLADALAAEGAVLTYYTRRQWATGNEPEAAFVVSDVWAGAVYDENGTRRIGAALRWSVALLRALWRADHDVLIVSATPVFNVFVAAVAKLRRPRTILLVDWLEIWPWKKWRAYSGVVAGTIAWVLQSVAVHIGDGRLVNSLITLGRLPRRARAAALLLPLASMAGAPLPERVSRGTGSRGYELLFVGRHIPDKNLPMLPRVVAALTEEFPGLRATVVGDGPDRALAEQISAELCVADRVNFVGRVSEDVLEEHLGQASALFFPSVREGFGLVVCEAARHGTPSVVVNHPDNAAVALVESGVNGAIAAEAGVDALTAATRQVLAGGVELRRATKAWYDAAWAQGGFAKVAQTVLASARRR